MKKVLVIEEYGIGDPISTTPLINALAQVSGVEVLVVANPSLNSASPSVAGLTFEAIGDPSGPGQF